MDYYIMRVNYPLGSVGMSTERPLWPMGLGCVPPGGF